MLPDATGLLSKAPTVPDAPLRAPDAQGAARRPAEAPFAWVLARLTQPVGEPAPAPAAEGPAADDDAAEPDAASARPEDADPAQPALEGGDGLEPAQPVVRMGVMDLVVTTLADLQTAAMQAPPAGPETGADGVPARAAPSAPEGAAIIGPAGGPRDPAASEGRLAGAATPPAVPEPEAAARVPDGATARAAGDAPGGLPPQGSGLAQPLGGPAAPLAGAARPAAATAPAGSTATESVVPALAERTMPAAGPARGAEGWPGAVFRQAAAAPERWRGTGERPVDAPVQQPASAGPGTAAQASGQGPVLAAPQPAGPGPEAGTTAGAGAAAGPEGLSPGSPDAAQPGSLAPGPATDPPRTAAAAQQVAQQVAQSLGSLPPRAAAGGMVVSLAPAELGRVTIRVDPDPQNPVLHLTVERPETLELMRRNIDVLEAALRELGRGDCTVQLDGRGDGSMAGRREPGAAAAPASAAPDSARPGTTAPEPRAPAASGRLDLRL